jgi:hypothetical protein
MVVRQYYPVEETRDLSSIIGTRGNPSLLSSSQVVQPGQVEINDDNDVAKPKSLSKHESVCW